MVYSENNPNQNLSSYNIAFKKLLEKGSTSALIAEGIRTFENSDESTSHSDSIFSQLFLEVLLALGKKESSFGSSSIDLTETEYKDISKILQNYIIERLTAVQSAK